MASKSGLGKRQISVMESLRDFGSWSQWSGWVWDTQFGTKRLLQSLVKRGMVSVKPEGHPARNTIGDVYRLTEEGRKALEES